MKPITLRIFFPYFGAKYMKALHYPAPCHDTIIEPFAGGAGYSLRYPDRRVILFDKDPKICGVWHYLIHVSSNEIMRLPLMLPGESVNDLMVPQEAKWLIGFWINPGSARPKVTMGGRRSNRAFGTWGEGPRQRLAEQVVALRHWQIFERDYSEVPNLKATWFIDPPYQCQGKQYANRISSYQDLADWSRQRLGKVMVCESKGANWMDFADLTNNVGATHRKTTEVLWTNDRRGDAALCQTPRVWGSQWEARA